MHHTISDSSIQPTQRTSKSAPKFLPENHDGNVCQPLCIGSWAEPASWSPNIHQVNHVISHCHHRYARQDIPSVPRENYSLLVMESTRMMKMATGEGFPPPAGCRNGSSRRALVKESRATRAWSATSATGSVEVITHKYRGSQQFSRVEYSTQIYWFDTRGAKEYSQVLAAQLSIQPHLET